DEIMEKITVKTRHKKMLADLYTPVSIYLRIRDKFPGSVLLESSDYRSAENSFSYIGIKPIAGMEINVDHLEYKYPNGKIMTEDLTGSVPDGLKNFLDHFQTEGTSPIPISQGLFGYTSYDAIQFFESLRLKNR